MTRHALLHREVVNREYWTPQQAALVLGRGRDFWIERYRNGNVRGYENKTPTGKRFTYLRADSCRDYLTNLENQEIVANAQAQASQGVEGFKSTLSKKGTWGELCR